jgi:hypothetical protein
MFLLPLQLDFLDDWVSFGIADIRRVLVFAENSGDNPAICVASIVWEWINFSGKKILMILS